MSRSYHRLILALIALCLSTSQLLASSVPVIVRASIDFGPAPIAADFFGPGSLPFDGKVSLIGVPLSPLGPENAIMDFGPTSGVAETIAIEMLQLQLVSAHPVAVSIGAATLFYDVFAELPAGPPATGNMILEPTSPTGGKILGINLNIGLETRWVQVQSPDERRIPVGPRQLGLPPLPNPGAFRYVDNSPAPIQIKDPPPIITEPPGVPDKETLEIIIMPEPSSWVMAAFALAATIMLARRTIARRI